MPAADPEKLREYNSMKYRYSKRKRFLLFFIGLVFAGFGVALSTRPGLGTTPISSLPYVTTFIIPWTLGMATVGINILFLLMQLAILRSRFHWSRRGQLLTLFGFGFFIDLGMWLSSFYIPEFYPLRLLEELLGCALLATGISFQLLADISFMPGDGVVRTVSEEYGFAFGTTKVCFDVSIVIAAIVVSLCWFREISGIREGTLLAAVLVGFIIRMLQQPLRVVKKQLVKA